MDKIKGVEVIEKERYPQVKNLKIDGDLLIVHFETTTKNKILNLGKKNVGMSNYRLLLISSKLLTNSHLNSQNQNPTYKITQVNDPSVIQNNKEINQQFRKSLM